MFFVAGRGTDKRNLRRRIHRTADHLVTVMDDMEIAWADRLRPSNVPPVYFGHGKWRSRDFSRAERRRCSSLLTLITRSRSLACSPRYIAHAVVNHG